MATRVWMMGGCRHGSVIVADIVDALELCGRERVSAWGAMGGRSQSRDARAVETGMVFETVVTGAVGGLGVDGLDTG